MLERRELIQRSPTRPSAAHAHVQADRGSCGVAFLIALVPLFAILFSLVQKGIKWWSIDFFTKIPQFPSLLDPNAVGGISNALIGSLVIDGIAALFAIPVGIVTGLFLAESSSRFANLLRMTAEIMTGLPSILLGIFSYQMLVVGSRVGHKASRHRLFRPGRELRHRHLDDPGHHQSLRKRPSGACLLPSAKVPWPWAPATASWHAR